MRFITARRFALSWSAGLDKRWSCVPLYLSSPKQSVTPMGWSNPSWRMLSAKFVRSPMSLRWHWPTELLAVQREHHFFGDLVGC